MRRLRRTGARPHTHTYRLALVVLDMPVPPAPSRMGAALTLHLVPVSFRDAVRFVAEWHRHNRPPRGHKYAVGVATPDGVLRGVVMVGRPVARGFDDGATLEVIRCTTDGTPNAPSMLYGAAARAAFALGYTRLVTYTQGAESGVSLRAAGWRIVAERPARPGWDVPSRPRDARAYTAAPRTLWEAP